MILIKVEITTSTSDTIKVRGNRLVIPSNVEVLIPITIPIKVEVTTSISDANKIKVTT